jgi:cyd operon protein YbgT
MWYLTWLFGIALALGAAVINLLWLERTRAFDCEGGE